MKTWACSFLLVASVLATACSSDAPSAPPGSGGAGQDAPDPGGAGGGHSASGLGDGGAGGDRGGPASCNLQSFSAPAERCSPETVDCLRAAQNEAQHLRCFDSDPPCASCLDEAYDHCVLGEPSSPGRCGELYACLADCVYAECGMSPSQACVDRASETTCRAASEEFDDCYDFAAPENDRCGDSAYETCFPRRPSRCGNGRLDAGETCDGDCPTCPEPTEECVLHEQRGSAATCDLECVQTPVPDCGPTCPINETPSTALGRAVFAGSFFDQLDFFTGGSCGLHGQDAVHAWRAPASGAYTFSLRSFGTYISFGEQHERTSSIGELEIASGDRCDAGAASLGCDTVKQQVRLSMTEGQDVLVIASRILHTGPSDVIYDLTAPYEIDISLCTPACAGRTCGDDGCGGSCGTCDAGQQCVSGNCACAPRCAGRECGDDGCGGSCGACGAGETCSAGRCVCTPRCDGRTCGSDGCFGSCGTCGLGTSCSAGTCVEDPDACDPVSNRGCMAPNECILLSSEQTRCVLTGPGTQGSACSATVTCDGGYGCYEGTCRKICDARTGAGCPDGAACRGVIGWSTYGACAER